MSALKKYFSWSLLIGFMAVVFWFSDQTAIASTDTSSSFIETVLNIVTFSLLSPEKLTEIAILIETPVRKLAHFTLYFIMGLLSFNALYNSNQKSAKKLIIFSLLICFFYAVSDEVHQIFVPGRAGMIGDVIIDTAGSLSGIFLITAMCKKRKLLF